MLLAAVALCWLAKPLALTVLRTIAIPEVFLDGALSEKDGCFYTLSHFYTPSEEEAPARVCKIGLSTGEIVSQWTVPSYITSIAVSSKGQVILIGEVPIPLEPSFDEHGPTASAGSVDLVRLSPGNTRQESKLPCPSTLFRVDVSKLSPDGEFLWQWGPSLTGFQAWYRAAVQWRHSSHWSKRTRRHKPEGFPSRNTPVLVVVRRLSTMQTVRSWGVPATYSDLLYGGVPTSAGSDSFAAFTKKASLVFRLGGSSYATVPNASANFGGYTQAIRLSGDTLYQTSVMRKIAAISVRTGASKVASLPLGTIGRNRSIASCPDYVVSFGYGGAICVVSADGLGVVGSTDVTAPLLAGYMSGDGKLIVACGPDKVFVIGVGTRVP